MTASLPPSSRTIAGATIVEVDAGGCLVAPGLINAHVHPGTSPRSRGLAEDAEIVEDGAYYHVTLPTQMLGPEALDDDDVAAITAWDVAAIIARRRDHDRRGIFRLAEALDSRWSSASAFAASSG